MYAQRVHFRQLPVLRWSRSYAGIEIPDLALFPLLISHPTPIKTRNPAPTSNRNSRFPPLFLAQIPNITAKKWQIPHPAKPIGDPLSGTYRKLVTCQWQNVFKIAVLVVKGHHLSLAIGNLTCSIRRTEFLQPLAVPRVLLSTRRSKLG